MSFTSSEVHMNLKLINRVTNSYISWQYIINVLLVLYVDYILFPIKQNIIKL